VTNTLGFNITSLQMINGVAVLNVQGAPGQTHQIQATTNLNPPIDWIPIATNMADSNGLFFSVDTQASNYMQRYYRSLRP
jgi:hypothetical protein